jgi:hypothetical protein
VIVTPGFRAAACIDHTTAMATSSGWAQSYAANDTVHPAQNSRLDSILDTLRADRFRDLTRFEVPADLDCPAGQRPMLGCRDSVPLIECEWTGPGAYRCWVKKWKCLPGGFEWQCQPVELRVEVS